MVPNGWKITSLGDICDGNLQTGPFGSQLHAHEYVDSGVSVLMPKDLIGFRSNLLEAAKITETKAQELKKHVLKSGDLLFSRRGDVTRFALIDKQAEGAICGTGCLKARPNQNHSPEFLAYFLQKDSVKKWLEQNAVGQTMPNMNTEILRELPLMSASSKYEEEKIAQILSTWDQAIAVTETLLEKSQQQKKALMQQLLTGKKRLLDENGVRFDGEWVQFVLGNLCNISTGKKDVNEGNHRGVYPFYTCASEPTYSDSYSYDCEALLIAGNGSVGKTHYIKGKFEAYQRTYILSHFSKTIESLFLYQFILCFLTKEIDREKQHGAMPYIKLSALQKFKIIAPPILEQEKITQVLSTADQEIQVLQQKLDCLKQEKKALMQQLLTGKRRVKVAA